MTIEQPITDAFARRRAGLLLHPTSLPSRFGNGDLGPEARNFLDFLKNSGMSLWQMLPTNPTHKDASPYNTLSSFAGDPRLISPDFLVEAGWR